MNILKQTTALNAWIATKITTGVGTMACAYAFAVLAFLGLPSAIASGQAIGWVSSQFLQLVLLSVIMVGQRVQGAKTEARDEETHAAVIAMHKETQEIIADLTKVVSS
ncbi:hypothetical protein [Subtercola vilae]|uniref:YiaAB two helix domain-containing protein n=1 Tax=Subtercola vilae TaxID=2056433 RepID=A0A4T2BTA0_9MICO|nr:hypothetical protein [Subtercola vilae]TIH34983.1 hypothetical protein D4765_11865 [Subtercola vilae]